ncbi:unnamed protein product, partial [Polarella glacialis]
MARLLAALGGKHTLRSLDLGGNEQIGTGLTSSQECAQEVASSLGQVGLQDLHLWRCGLGDAACALVVDAKPPRLKLLNLAANPLSAALKSKLLRSPLCGPSGYIRM